MGSIEEETAVQERRLADAKALTAKFFDNVRALCNTQLKNIAAVSAGLLPQDAPADDVEETVRSIESSVAKAQSEPQLKLDLGGIQDAPEAPRGFDSTQPFSF